MSSDQSNNLTNLLSKDVTKISREAPMNIGAEQALLGAILSNNLALEKVENFLEPEHFSSKINALIFKTLKKLISNDQVADLNTLKVFLENDPDFISNGGISYLLKISENSISIINSKQYGELIYDLFIRRKLIDLGTNLINDSYDNFDDKNFQYLKQLLKNGETSHDFWEYLRKLEFEAVEKNYLSSLQKANYFLMELSCMRNFWKIVETKL